jgi:hypothetical protein
MRCSKHSRLSFLILSLQQSSSDVNAQTVDLISIQMVLCQRKAPLLRCRCGRLLICHSHQPQATAVHILRCIISTPLTCPADKRTIRDKQMVCFFLNQPSCSRPACEAVQGPARPAAKENATISTQNAGVRQTVGYPQDSVLEGIREG